ncbi:MAG: hypothetical protein JNM56_04920 [Planctomycetia bacterium]|nr:hypothetical protein [Planctomycetia bacterium]
MKKVTQLNHVRIYATGIVQSDGHEATEEALQWYRDGRFVLHTRNHCYDLPSIEPPQLQELTLAEAAAWFARHMPEEMPTHLQPHLFQRPEPAFPNLPSTARRQSQAGLPTMPSAARSQSADPTATAAATPLPTPEYGGVAITRLLPEALCQIASMIQAPTSPPQESACPLTVCDSKVFLRGQLVMLNVRAATAAGQCAYLQVLINHFGHYISDRDATKEAGLSLETTRLDKYRAKLPKEIREMLETDPHQGTRIKKA